MRRHTEPASEGEKNRVFTLTVCLLSVGHEKNKWKYCKMNAILQVHDDMYIHIICIYIVVIVGQSSCSTSNASAYTGACKTYSHIENHVACAFCGHHFRLATHVFYFSRRPMLDPAQYEHIHNNK